MEDKILENNYRILKALSDINRMLIIKNLTNGEMCACKILQDFKITQPTLSHHMKILSECGIINSRKDGKWTHYSLNRAVAESFQQFVFELTSIKSDV